MSSEEADSKKRKRKTSPLQHLRKGDKSYYVLNANASEEKIYTILRVGEPSTSKDEKLSIKNLCFGMNKNDVERFLINHEGKFRIPSDKELTLIFSICKKKEDATFKTKNGKDIKLYDPRWTKGGLKAKWEKKHGSSSSSAATKKTDKKKKKKKKSAADAKAADAAEPKKEKKKKPSKKKSKVSKDELQDVE